ncbi:Trans-aconitate methyltransferase [Rhypophila decipiens]
MLSPSSIPIPVPAPAQVPSEPPSPPGTPPGPENSLNNTDSKPKSPSVPESTFKSYTPSQASTYAERRKGYSSNLYNYILSYHKATGGGFAVLFDVGCGPGIVTRDLAGEFETVFGVDSGREMINTAEKLGGVSKSGQDIRYFVGEAEGVHEMEELKKLLLGHNTGGVDLVTAGTAAHWFDMPRFWESMAKIVKPGGTLALWSLPNIHCHPSTPNADQIQAILTSFRDDILKPYMQAPSLLNADMYRGIPLPWDSPTTAPFFDKDYFIHQIWDEPPSATPSHPATGSHDQESKASTLSTSRTEEDERLSPILGKMKPKEKKFFTGSKRFTLANFRDSAVTMNSVTRWREAHPDLAETEEDVIYQLIERLRRALGRGKEEDLADIWIEAGMSTVLVLVKRSEVPCLT